MSKRTKWLIVMVMAALVAWGAETPTQTITIPEEVNVTGDQFTLGDIAQIVAAPNVQKTLSDILLGMSPRAGLQRAFTRAQIEIRLKQHGLDPKAFKFNMPITICLKRSSQNVSVEMLINAAKARLKEQFGDNADNFTVMTAPKPLPIPEGDFKCETDPVVNRSGNAYAVTVRLTQNDKGLGTYRISFLNEKPKTVMVVKTGDPIKVEFNSGAILLSATGEARTSGGIGDSISVYLPGTKKIVKAVITSERTAQLKE